VAAKAGRGEVLLSRTARDLVLGSELTLVERGARALKGLPGRWRLYAVQG
jgi:class 3 adenylate cyclase